MLSSKGFDLWANDYDKSVGLSDEDETYPFAGYKDVLNEIYNRVLSLPGKTVLDIGFGTGTLTAKLYEQGCQIFGQDFSAEMLRLAQEKMPEAKLFQGNFSLGLREELRGRQYDAIIATYSLHHLTDPQKIRFLKELLPLLNEGGCICIGDVAFQNREALEQCKAQVGSGWDEDEIYFVFDELSPFLPQMKFQQISHCAGILFLEK